MKRAEKILKDHRLSVTEARKSVLEFFIKMQKPLSVKDIRNVKKFSKFNESSIYRNLTKLEEVGIIQIIPGAGDFQSYELVPTGHHHHHIVCTKCNSIKCLDICGLEKKMKTMAERVGFSLSGHSVELMGICPGCQ